MLVGVLSVLTLNCEMFSGVFKFLNGWGGISPDNKREGPDNKVFSTDISQCFIERSFGNFLIFPVEILRKIYDFNPSPNILWLSLRFVKWYEVFFQKLLLELAKHKLKNQTDTPPSIFWEKHVYVVYFVFLQMKEKIHINFSFRDNSCMPQEQSRLQREYVHALLNASYRFYPNYTNRKTHKKDKKEWNDEYESDSYDDITDTWNYKYSGPCHHHWITYYIPVYPKKKNERTKKLCTVRFNDNNIECL